MFATSSALNFLLVYFCGLSSVHAQDEQKNNNKMDDEQMMMDPDMIDQEDLIAMLGDHKIENLQQLLKEALVDANFYNSTLKIRILTCRLWR